jgi:hypothetical protein
VGHAAAVGRKVVEGAEEGTEACATCCDKAEAWLDSGPDGYVSVLD